MTVPKTISITTFRCSACNRKFTVALVGQKEIACPHCRTKAVLARGEWQDKKLHDFLKRERCNKDKC